jgi:tetratricopeptide (TPR) repeat protein
MGMLHDIRGKEHFEYLKSLDSKADDAFTRGNTKAALDLYKELNEGWILAEKLYPASKSFDVNLAAKTQKMLEIVSVVPLSEEVNRFQKAAEEATKIKDWKSAEEMYTKAIETQERINREYASTVYASFTKTRDLQIELDSLKTAPIESEIEEAIQKAKTAEGKGDYNTAAEFFKLAFDKQRSIIINFERSRSASKENLEKISAMMETAQSRQLFDSIKAQKKRLDDLLRAGGESLEIPSLCENLLLDCERFKDEFPKSNLLDEDLVLSLRYLGFLAKNISLISKTVLQDMIPIAPESKILMMKKEVTQSLYRLVMQENPSRSQDELKPVETVSYSNVQDFCRRLSWITARKITLPKPSEFREAIGSLKYVDLNAIAWHAGNSGLQTQRAGTKDANIRGFYDLLGNVAEFTMPEHSFSKPGIIGGSAQTWTDSLSEIPFNEVDPSIRGDRMIGFRIVIRDNGQ